MSSTQTTAELSKILNDYYNSMGHIYPDIERLKNLLSQVSYAQRCELLSSIRGDEVLIEAARLGKTELCVTLLSSLPQADRLKLKPVDELRAFHFAALWRYTETILGILNCLTAEQQLQLLCAQDSDGNTALHDAARWGHTETVKTLLDNITPEQQLKILSVQNNAGKTASQYAAAAKQKEIESLLKKYERDADFEVNYGKWEHYNVMTGNRGLNRLSNTLIVICKTKEIFTVYIVYLCSCKYFEKYEYKSFSIQAGFLCSRID